MCILEEYGAFNLKKQGIYMDLKNRAQKCYTCNLFGLSRYRASMHYGNTPIQIYLKFYNLNKGKFSDK